MSGQFGTGAEVSYGHSLPKCLTDTLAPVPVPKCLGSEVSSVWSVLTPCDRIEPHRTMSANERS